MTKFLQTLLDGISVGSLYALIALGYTMVYGVLRFINFAHGDIFMLGAWFSFTVASWLGWVGPDANPPLYAGILVMLSAMTLCAVLGASIERLAYRPLRSAPRLNVLITAIGVSLFLENAGQLKILLGSEPVRMPALLPERTLFTIASVDLHLVDVLVVALAVALMLGLQWLVYHTRMGLAMRAVSFDQRVAALMGVPVDAVITVTFILGSALAAAAGFLYASKYPGLNQPAHSQWILLGLKAFVAAVVGGIGNIRGAMLGGLLIGLVEIFGAAYRSPQLRDVYVFAILIIVLLIKPTGILGRASLEKI